MFDETIGALVEKSRKAIKTNPGDYQGDGSSFILDENGNRTTDGEGRYLTDMGLWYCGKCHKLKQYPFYFSDHKQRKRLFVPNTLCECEEKAERAADDRVHDRAKAIKVHQNLSQADKLMLKNTFKKDRHPTSSMSRIAREYVDKWRVKNLPQNIGLYIYGDVGVGKTFYASCIANDIVRIYGDTVKALSVNMALNELFSSANDKAGYIAKLASYDLLILDDLGSQPQNEYNNGQLFSIIDERYKAQKPLIITSNCPLATLKASPDMQMKRIADRLNDMCLPIKQEGKSQRGIQNRLTGS